MAAKHTFKDWLIAVRPWSFPASVMPLVTMLYLFWVWGDIRWGYGVWALVNMILFHCAANTWSDWFDFRKKVDAEDTFGAKTITSGQFTPREIRNLSLGLMLVSVAGGVSLLFLTGLPLLWIGIGGILCALLYPPLKYAAAGDLVIFLAFGMFPAIGTSYVVLGHIDWSVLWVAVPVGLITVAILHINNLRDIRTDSRAGISTLAMHLGAKASIRVYNFEVIFPFFWVFACVIEKIFPWWSLLVFLAAFPALLNVRTAIRYKREGMSAIVHLDEGTARLQVLFSLSMSVGFLVAALFR